MYESPIDISYSDMILKTMDEMSKKWNQESDNHVMACVNQFVKVDKDELIRALEYDRKQYEKGYEDGKRDAGEWINVKERLPEIGQMVLTYSNDCGAEYKVLRMAFSDLYKAAGLGDGWYWESIDYMTEYPDEYKIDRITHWMPLPEPPEVEGEEKRC